MYNLTFKQYVDCVFLLVEFVHHCIKHILSLYGSVKNPPTSVVLVGHSMVSEWVSIISNHLSHLHNHCYSQYTKMGPQSLRPIQNTCSPGKESILWAHTTKKRKSGGMWVIKFDIIFTQYLAFSIFWNDEIHIKR